MKKLLTAQNILLTALLLVLVPFLVLSLFAHPQVDDRWFSNQALELGFFKSMSTWYLTWSGRYSTCALLSFNPMYFDFVEGYKINPIIMLLSFQAVFMILLDALFDGALTLKEKIIGALLLLLTLLIKMPGIADGIYWLGAAITYMFTGILILLLLYLLMQYEIAKAEQRAGRRYVIGICLLIVFISGANETAMFVLFMLIALIAAKRFLTLRRINWTYVLFGAISGCCTLVVMSSPGNNARWDFYPTKHNLSFSLINAFSKCTGDCYQWFIAAPTIIITILMIPYVIRIADRNSMKIETIRCHPAYALAVFMGLVYACFFLIFWNIGDTYWPVRTENFIHLVFLMGWFYFAFMLILHLHAHRADWLRTTVKFALALMILFALVPMYDYKNNNLHLSLKELFDGTLSTYNMEMYKRYGDVKLCQSDYCEVEPLTYHPKTVTFEDITPNPLDYRNVQFAKSFNKKAVAVKMRNIYPVPPGR